MSKKGTPLSTSPHSVPLAQFFFQGNTILAYVTLLVVTGDAGERDDEGAYLQLTPPICGDSHVFRFGGFSAGAERSPAEARKTFFENMQLLRQHLHVHTQPG